MHVSNSCLPELHVLIAFLFLSPKTKEWLVFKLLQKTFWEVVFQLPEILVLEKEQLLNYTGF